MILKLKALFADPRHFQILYLSIFLMYGVHALDWESNVPYFLTIIGTCLCAQAIGIVLTTKNWHSLKSGLITALGLCLLLRVNEWWVAALAAAIAIGSKYLIRFRGKHIFNPANIGIIAVILFTKEAWISPGQWGSDIAVFFAVGFASLVILLRVGRIDTSLVFLAVLISLQYCRTVLYLGWSMDHLIHQFSNGSLLLFTFFMITDPMTTPNSKKARYIWAALIAILSFAVSNYFYFHTAPIWVLVAISPLTPFLDKWLKGEKFEWKTT